MATVLDELIVKIGPEIVGTAGLKRLDKRLNAMKAKLSSFGTAAIRAGTVVTGLGVSVAFQGIKTDAALRQLEARTGASADQLERFKKQAYEIGSQLPLNTADIIRAQTAFVQLGNSMEATEKATPGIAMAAVAAEGVNVEDAARFADRALRAFNLDASETTYLLDQMLKAETKTPATMREIGEAFKYSAQSAADAGLDTASYIATLGTLAGSGRSAEESSQGFNVLLQKLSKGMTGVGRGGKMVEKVLAKAGISMEDLAKMKEVGGPDWIFNFLETLEARRR